MKVKAFQEPYRHWILTDAVSTDLLGWAPPPPGDLGWVWYNNDCEYRKRTRRPAADEASTPLFDHLMSADFIGALKMAIGGSDALLSPPFIRPDHTLYGAGIHVTDPGGWLQPHVDFAINPADLPQAWERRFSLILFINAGWREEWGGGFELWDDAARAVVKRIFPAFNTAVVFENGDAAFHGTQQTTDDAPPRITAACYYLCPPRPGACRKRALFVPRR